MYVAGLEHETVVTPEEASECLRRGNEQRATAATGEFFFNFEKLIFVLLFLIVFNLNIRLKIEKLSESKSHLTHWCRQIF